MRKLYIIGNGFDIHHGIDSSYRSFREYCRLNQEELYLKLENYHHDSDLLWSDFEIGLSDISPEYILDFAKIGNNDWDTSYKGMYAFVDGVQEEMDYLQISIKGAFAEWIEQLGKGNRESRLSFMWDDALFLSFNYTPTLEYLYGIPRDRICYLHGKAATQFSQLVFGHCCNRNEIEAKMPDDNELEDEALNEVVEFLMALRKDSDTVIQQQSDFFEALRNVDNVYVLGHSLAIVDDPYFEKIKQVVSTASNWTVSYYSDADRANIDRLMGKLNVPLNQYKPIKLGNIGNEFYPSLFS